MSHTASSDDTGTTDDSGQGKRKAGLFDIRTFIAALIGIYGIVLIVMGLVGTDDTQLAKSDGININLWAGIAMVVVAALFQAWAKWRPVVVPENPEDAEDSDEERRINEG